MDSKFPFDAPPPAYTATADAAVAPPIPAEGSQLDPLTSHLHEYVAALPGRMRMTQEAWRAAQRFGDAAVLEGAVPAVAGFLADVGAQPGRAPPRATLTLVPDGAVPRAAVLSSAEDMRRRGELCRVARVAGPARGGAGAATKEKAGRARDPDGEDPSWAPGREFSDWGRFGDEDGSAAGGSADPDALLWWRDEDMARRLAGYLQPPADPDDDDDDDAAAAPAVELSTPVRAAVEARIPAKKDKKKAWGWGRSRGSQTQTEAPLPAATPAAPPAAGSEKRRRRGTVVTATAEEVSFRHENAFGLLESLSGWGVVVTVEVKI
ncbi:hypothetical protein GGS23DRAFT_610647 [Durotheca rogersii]|uniref:uncharacterized protein n=1 Tax=Durotheca rogersii TaxID=419775 RepID=UPI002220C4E1|nr:uncharacterized protein GGS23DRAFT_610647 [Durotheca rogersii]KAI5862448.1 hypothetical protein GGS23DRAFT_610647 [Durotheca rogersii]